MTDLRLSFKDMCTRFGVTPRTLRHYEYIELLAPERVGRARFYGRRDIARTTLILRGRRFGFSLEEIRQWLELHHTSGNDVQLATFVQFANQQLAKLQQQRDDMTTTIHDLARTRDDAARSLDGAAVSDRAAQLRAG